MRILKEIKQGTDEWLKARLGVVTGTRLKQVMGNQKSKFGLVCELISEEATEQMDEIPKSKAMQRGNIEEDYSLKLFEKQTDKEINTGMFCLHNEHDWLGLSPDGLSEDLTEAFESKSPKSKNMVASFLRNTLSDKESAITSSTKPIFGIPAQYIWQVVHYFIVNEKLLKLDFCEYDERMINEKLKLKITTVTREQLQPLIEQAEKELLVFREFWIRCRELFLINNF